MCDNPATAANEATLQALKRFKVTKYTNEEKLFHLDEKVSNVNKITINEKVNSDIFNQDITLKEKNERDKDDASMAKHDLDEINYLTHDAMPLSIYYRNEDSNNKIYDKRPTLEQLHNGDFLKSAKLQLSKSSNEKQSIDIKNHSAKFGWVKGVLVPTILNIWGVILFLRLPWVVGEAGILMASGIVLLATIVTTLTTLSMSAICTNGEVKGGGAYYMISRSLGPEFGGSIGVIFAIANAVAVSLYLVGFAETIQSLLERYDFMLISRTNDIRIIGLVALILIFFLAIIGLNCIIHVQSMLLALLILAILSVCIGTIHPSLGQSREVLRAIGLTSYNFDTFKENLKPLFRDSSGFFGVFAIFFPAVTGIMAGANLSGDLKDPSKSVPRGTLLAILITSSVYMVLCWLLGATVMREVTIVTFGTVHKNETGFGLLHDLQIMEKISLWGPLVQVGIICATLSSAISSLVSAPKVFQAVCKDKIFPYIEVFGKSYGVKREPRNAYLVTFVFAASFIAIGDVNLIAPIISNFFLMGYALVNYSVFISSLSKSPAWRPSFKYYNQWMSLFGFLLCIVIMFLINWWGALITLLFVTILYKFVDIRKPNVNWGSLKGAHTYLQALRLMRRLEAIEEHVKNYRVQVLCLSGQPSSRPNLVRFVSQLTNRFGLLVCGEVTKALPSALTKSDEAIWLKRNNIKAFHQILQKKNIGKGAKCLLQAVGLGKLKPNTLMMGFMSRWQTATVTEVTQYVQIVHDAFDLNYGVGILRISDGFETMENAADVIINEEADDNHADNDTMVLNERQVQDHKAPEVDFPKETRLTFEKMHKGYIDIWWLYDDGGLTILVSYLLSLNKHWMGCKLRVFTPESNNNVQANQIKMTSLLNKFRINFSCVVEFSGINTLPSDHSVNTFKKFHNGEHLPINEPLDKKTLQQIRLGELLREHSSKADLVLISLPIPKRSFVTPLMYMSWLEVLTADLPPTLLIRGNHTSVLTFHS